MTTTVASVVIKKCTCLVIHWLYMGSLSCRVLNVVYHSKCKWDCIYLFIMDTQVQIPRMVIHVRYMVHACNRQLLYRSQTGWDWAGS